MKVLTASQMRAVDELTIREHHVPGPTLMENAGAAVARTIEKRYGVPARVLVLCGKGNNGGDGFVVARLLAEKGAAVRVVLFADPAAIQGDAKTMFDRWGKPVDVVKSSEGWKKLKSRIADSTLVVDAVLGTGLSGPVKGYLQEVFRDINTMFARLPVVAVDMPSGLPSDTGEVAGETMRADITVTFTAPKVGQVLPPACERVGDLVIAGIGTPPEVYESRKDWNLNLIVPKDLRPFMQPRKRGAHKGDFGHVLVVAGARGKTGAAVMAAEAALKVGSGLVTVATADSALPVIASFIPELMTEPLPETEIGSISDRALENGRFAQVAAGKDVIAMGPGLGPHPETVTFVRRVVAEARVPLVLDADALNALGTDIRLLHGRPAATVVTPHPGEMSRMTGMSTRDVQADRIETARRIAEKRGVVVALKGYRTVVAAPDGQVYINPTGNPGMAKGGTGDVLTGLIAGMLAQFPDQPVEKSVCAAVYIHGLGADIAVQQTGEKSLMATDIIRALPKVWRRLAAGH